MLYLQYEDENWNISKNSCDVDNEKSLTYTRYYRYYIYHEFDELIDSHIEIESVKTTAI